MIKDRLQIARGSAARITSFLNSFRDYEIIFNTDTNRLGIVLPDKTIVYISELDINEHNTNENAHTGIRNAVAEAKAIAEGKSRARVFATKSALDTWLLDSENVALLQIGDNFYIEETDKPDYWWNGTTIKELETQKVDLTEYAKSNDLAMVATTGSYNDLTNTPTIPTIPNISITNGSAESGKYISQVAVDATDKHKLVITKADLPQGFSGDFGDLTNVPKEFPPSEHNHDGDYYKKNETYTKTEIDAMIGDIETLLGGI